MKTSNRILLIFTINIFLIPICLFIGFNSMIRNGNYTLVKATPGQETNGILKSGHIVKLVGSNRDVVLNIHYTPDKIQWIQNGHLRSGDSISVTNIGDTITVRYIGKKELQEPEGIKGPLYVNLLMPVLSKLIVQNAQANVISVDSSRTQKIEANVSDNGVLNLGGGMVDGFVSTPENKSKGFNVDQLLFQTDNGKLEIGKGVQIHSLQLHVTGNSALKLDAGAAIKEVSGEVSSSTQIDARWETVKQLLPIVK